MDLNKLIGHPQDNPVHQERAKSKPRAKSEPRTWTLELTEDGQPKGNKSGSVMESIEVIEKSAYDAVDTIRVGLEGTLEMMQVRAERAEAERDSGVLRNHELGQQVAQQGAQIAQVEAERDKFKKALEKIIEQEPRIQNRDAVFPEEYIISPDKSVDIARAALEKS